MSILFRNIAFFDSRFDVLQGDIRTNGPLIEKISKGMSDTENADEVIEGAGLLLAPGFVNAHFHSQTTLALGMTRQERASEYEFDDVRSGLEAEFMNWVDKTAQQADFSAVCEHSYAELLANGVTATQDSGYGERPTAILLSALERIGMRGVLDAYQAINERINGATDLVTFGGHLPEEEDLRQDLKTAIGNVGNLSVPLFTHSLETLERRRIALDAFGRSPLAVFEEAGVLDNRTVLFHVVHADEDDIALLKQSGAHVVHCPVSNARLGAGIAPIAAMLRSGVNVALGTDWAFANPWENMRLAWYLANAQGGHLAAHEVWHMATRAGAVALRLNTGEIAPGRLADMMVLDISPVELQPLMHDRGFSTFAHNLLLEGDRRLVRSVLVGGRWSLRDHKLVRIDGASLDRQYRKIIQTLYPGIVTTAVAVSG